MGANALRINGSRDPQCWDAAAAPQCAREEGLDLAAPCASGELWLPPGVRPHGCAGGGLLPVLVLMFSVPTVCPMRWYWFSLEPSSATTTDLAVPLVQT